MIGYIKKSRMSKSPGLALASNQEISNLNISSTNSEATFLVQRKIQQLKVWKKCHRQRKLFQSVSRYFQLPELVG